MSNTGETYRSNKRANSGTLEGDNHPKRQKRSGEDALSSEGGEISEDKKKRLAAFNALLKNHGWAGTLKRLPILQDEDKIVEAFVEREGKALEFASDRLKDDKTIVMTAVQQYAYALEFASPRLQYDPEVVLQAVKYDGVLFQYASEELQKDREIIKHAVKLDPSAIKYCSREALADEDFLVELVLLDQGALGDSELITKNFALKLVKNGALLMHLADEFKADREIVMEAVKHRGASLCWASLTLRSDPEFVLKAVKLSGSALQGACDALKEDAGIVLEAVKQDWGALMYAPDQMIDRPEIILEAVKQKNFWLIHPWEMDRRIVLEAVKWKPYILRSASDALRADDQIVLEAVKLNGLQLRQASAGLRANVDIVLEAVSQNGLALEFADERLRGRRDVVLVAVRNMGEAIQYALGTSRVDPHVLAAAIRSSMSFKLPEDTEKLLLSIVSGIGQQHDWEGGRAVSFQDAPNQVEGTAAHNYAEQVWKLAIRHKIWLLQQKLQTRVDTGPIRSILECCGINEEFRLADELVRLSPIFAALADRGINWNGIPFALGWRTAGVYFLDRTRGL